MKFFYDTEFIERGPEHPLEFISLGVVAEDGRELYCVSREFNPAHANSFVREQVLPGLPPPEDPAWKSRSEIAAALRAFVGQEVPEWWGDCAAYDHVLLCQLFGDMDGLPRAGPTSPTSSPSSPSRWATQGCRRRPEGGITRSTTRAGRWHSGD